MPLTLIDFQKRAADAGVELFEAAKSLLDAAGEDASGRATAVAHNGYLLIEAPTGAGKTIIAGTIAEKFSGVDNVVWFWFAPFKGVVGQTAAFLREQFHGLRVRELSEDRSPEQTRGGDVFVTTWQSVATRVADRRNVRVDGELRPSVDNLLEALRSQGMRVGVVVDEAHHGFGNQTLAAQFFREVLKPEYTLLVTATPDDQQISAFERAMNIPELHRNTISRGDAVDAGLIKMGVKCAAYFVDPDKRALVDLQTTALRDGVAAHRTIKRKLEDLGIPLVPLMLVQAENSGNVAKLKEQLLQFGFSESQIAVHTAKEPDAGLLALANDESREVLIFVMAVALGFDAPRAFTLVSMRATRDPDFGVQLVGRILRTHRRLQKKARDKKLPDELNYGYVFLADPDTQGGLDVAAQRINQIQTAYAKVSASVVTVPFQPNYVAIRSVDQDGNVPLFDLEPPPGGEFAPRGGFEEPERPPETFDFGQFFPSGTTGDTQERESERPVAGVAGTHRYALKDGVPRQFMTQEVPADNQATEEDCANRFTITIRHLFEGMRSRVRVERRTMDLFTRELQRELDFGADLSHERAAFLAQRALTGSRVFDPRELRQALLKKMALVMKEELVEGADDPRQVQSVLNVILASHPKLLRDAQKEALAAHSVVEQAEPLPAELTSNVPLRSSVHNVYGVMPMGLNTWERPFAEMLDRDSNNIVLWWHRNPPRQPYSINVLMEDGRGFFPDFIVGIAGRNKLDHGLLADPKMGFEREAEAPKVRAEHREYGRVLILSYQESRFMTVGYDAQADRPVVVGEFRLSDAAGF